MVGGVPDVITCAKFQIEIFMGYDFTGGRIFDFRFSYSAVLLYDKRNASICVLSHIAFTLCLFFCVVRNISATATPVGVEICVMVHIGPRHVFSHFVGGFARVPKSKILVD